MGTRLDTEWGNLTKAERVQRYHQFAQEARKLSLSATSPHCESYADLASRWEQFAEAIERETNQRAA